MTEPLIIDLSEVGRRGVSLPACDVPETALPPETLLRDSLDLPEVSEGDLMRHFVHLSQMNYAVDIGMYPLGSCTMKYNPKVNEDAAALPGFASTHPYQPAETVQGNLKLMYGLQECLNAITGFAAASLQPAAGAQGELTGALMIRAYHQARGDTQRTLMLIPDSAHGTNPASTAMVGMEMVEIKSDARGLVDLADLRAHLSDRVAGMMLTNPNTLGLFERDILEITRMVHDVGGLMYGDGANLNALLGIVRPAELGFDVMHLNLHKTFSTPHGGGGPGSGPVVAAPVLADFLPGPTATAAGPGDKAPYGLTMPVQSIGRVKAFYGHFGILVRAYTYIRMLGAAGLKGVSQIAVLNANYLQALLKDTYPVPHAGVCMHEFVAMGQLPDASDVRALDIAKRLIDYGYHPPTNYFPLIVPEALMIEPTETEPKRVLDAFAQALIDIAREAREQPELLHAAPVNSPVGRMDEVRAARTLVLRWQDRTTTE